MLHGCFLGSKIFLIGIATLGESQALSYVCLIQTSYNEEYGNKELIIKTRLAEGETKW